MAAGSSGASIRLPIELEIQNMQQIANTLRQFAKSNLLSNSLGGKQIEQELNSIIRKLSQVEIKAKGAFKSDSSLGSLETQLRGIETSMGHVQGLFGQLSFKDLQLPPEIQSQFAELGKRISEIQDKIANLSVETMGKLKLDSALNFDLSKIFTPDKAGKLLDGTFDKLQSDVTQRASELENQLRMAGENLKKAKDDLVTAVSSGGEGDYRMLQALKGLQAGFSDPKKAPEWMKQHWQLSDDGKTFRTFMSGNHSTEFYNALQAQYSLTDEQRKELEERMHTQKMALNKTMVEVLRESVMGDGKAFLGKDKGIAQTLAAQYEEASKAADKAAKDQQEAQEKLARAQHAVGIIQTAGQGMQTSMAPLRKELDGVVNSVTNLEQATLRSVKGNQVLQHSFQGMGGALKQVNGAIDQGRQQLASTDAQYRKMDGITSYIGRYFSAYAIIHKAVSAIKNAINEIKAIDKVITNIAVVTNMSQEQLWGKIGEYTSIAQSYGVATKDVYTVSQIFYQQGLQTADVMSLTTETLKMAKIAGMDYQAAANAMTVAVRAFKLEMSEAQQVTDTYSALAAKFAVNSAEIANAMEKTASSAASVGMSLQSTSAFMSVMIQTTRESAQNIGSAMKSIISRYGEMKASPDQLLNIDGEEAAFNKVDTALASIGISIKDASGQFRDFDDVIMELAAKWDSLDNNTQRYIATIMAGNRQQSRFIALVSNYDELSRAMTVANSAENASIVQVAKTMDSIETKTQQLHNAWSQLYLDLHLEEAFKGVLGSLTQILSTIGDLGIAMGGLPTLMTVIGGGKALAKLPQVLKEKGITGNVEKWAQKKTAEHHNAEAYATSKDQKETISIKKLEKQYAKAQKRGDTATIKDLEERYADYFAKKNNKNLEAAKQEQTPEQAMTGVLEGGFSDVIAGGHADADAIVAAINSADKADTDTAAKYPVTPEEALTQQDIDADNFIAGLTDQQQAAIQEWDEALQERNQAREKVERGRAAGFTDEQLKVDQARLEAAEVRVQQAEKNRLLTEDLKSKTYNFETGILSSAVARRTLKSQITKADQQQQEPQIKSDKYQQRSGRAAARDEYEKLSDEQRGAIDNYTKQLQDLEDLKSKRDQARQAGESTADLDQPISSLESSMRELVDGLKDVLGPEDTKNYTGGRFKLAALVEASQEAAEEQKKKGTNAAPDNATPNGDEKPKASEESEKPEQPPKSEKKPSYSDLSDQDKETIQAYAQAREQKKIADSRLAFAKQDLEAATTQEERDEAQGRVTKAEEAVASAAEAMDKAAESAKNLSGSFDELADEAIAANKDVDAEVPKADEDDKDNTKGKTKVEDTRTMTDKLGDFFSSKGFQFAQAIAPIVGAAVTGIAAAQKPTSDSNVEWNKVLTGVGNGLSMAAQGAELGSILGPWGTLIGSIGGFLIGGVGAIIDGLNVSAKERYEMAKEEAAKAKEESLKANAKTIDLSSRIEEISSLRKTMYNSTEDMQKYKEAMNNMAADYPELIANYDEAGNKIIDLNAAEELLIQTRIKAAKAATDNAEAEVKVQRAKINQYSSALAESEDSYNLAVYSSNKDQYDTSLATAYSTIVSTIVEDEKLFEQLGYIDQDIFKDLYQNQKNGSLMGSDYGVSFAGHIGFETALEILENAGELSKLFPAEAERERLKNVGTAFSNQKMGYTADDYIKQAYMELNNALKNTADLKIQAVNGADQNHDYIAGLLGYSEEKVQQIQGPGGSGWTLEILEEAINALKQKEEVDIKQLNLLESQLTKARGEESFLTAVDQGQYSLERKSTLTQMSAGGSLVTNLAAVRAGGKDTLQEWYETEEGAKQAQQYLDTAAKDITGWLGNLSSQGLNDVISALNSASQYTLEDWYKALGLTIESIPSELKQAIDAQYAESIADARGRINNILGDGTFKLNEDFEALEKLLTETDEFGKHIVDGKTDIGSYEVIGDLKRLYDDIQKTIPEYSDFFADQLIEINNLAKDGYTELAKNRLKILEKLASEIKGITSTQQHDLYSIISTTNFTDFDSLVQAKESIENYAKNNNIELSTLQPILDELDYAMNSLVFNVNTLAQSLVNNISGAAKNINTILTTNKSGLDFSQALDEYSKMYAKDSTIGNFEAIFQYDAALKKFVYTDIGLNNAIQQTNQTLEENANQLEKTAKQRALLSNYLKEAFSRGELLDNEGKVETTKINQYTNAAIDALKSSSLWDVNKGFQIDEDTYLSEASLRTEYENLLIEYANSGSADDFNVWLEQKATESNQQFQWALKIHEEYQKNIASQYFAAIDWAALATGVDPGGVNKLYKEKLIEELNKKGNYNLTNDSSLEQIIAAYAEAYELTEQDVERAVKQNILQSKSQSITTAINELLKGPGTIVSEATRELLRQAGEINAISSTGQIIAEGDALIKSVKAVYEAKRNSFLTLAERNASYAEIIAAEAQQALDTRTLLQSGGTGIDIKTFGTIAANKGFSLDTILANLDFYGLAQDIFGNIIIKNFELFAEVFDLDINSPEYATYYDQYAKAMVDLQNQPVTLMQNATKELKDLLSGSYVGQAFNVSQLEIAAKDMGIENIESIFNKYGVTITNGVATLTNVAASNLQGLVTEIIFQMEASGQAIPAELAALKDAIIATLDNIVTLIKNGISGSLSNEKSVQLQSWADQFNINLDFTSTAEGLKLSQQSATELYYALQGVDHIRAQLVFNALSDSLKSTNENYESVASVMARIEELEKAIKDTSDNINQSNREVSKAKIQQYEQELSLAKEILAVRMTKEDNSYNFMSNKVPGAQQNQLDYYQNWATAAQKVNDAFDVSKNSKNGQTGFIDYQDWYNIVNEINHIAGATGTEIEIAGVVLDGKLEKAASLIQKGADALTTIDTGEVKVNLGAAGLNIKSAGQLLTKDVNTGIQKFTQAEAEMLDGYIQLLEVIVAMEGLDDVVGEDMTLDLPDIIFEPPVAPDGSVLANLVKGYTVPYNRFRKKLLTYLDEDNKLFNKDLNDAMSNLKIFDPTAKNGEGAYLSMKEILGMDSKKFEELGEQAQNDYAAALNAFYQAYRRGDYDPEDPVGSIERILGETKLNNVEFTLDDQTILYKNGVALVKSEKGDTWEVNGKEFNDPDAAVQYAKTSSIGALTGFENKVDEKTGETTYTLTDNLHVDMSYNVENGQYTAKFNDDENTVITADSEEALNFAVQAFLNSKSIQSNTSSESNNNSTFSFTVTQNGTVQNIVTVDKTTGVVTDGTNDVPYDPEDPDSYATALAKLGALTYGEETPKTPEETPGETTTTTTTNTMEITDVTNVVLKGAATGETGEDGLPVYEPIPSISAKAKELKITEIEKIKVEGTVTADLNNCNPTGTGTLNASACTLTYHEDGGLTVYKADGKTPLLELTKEGLAGSALGTLLSNGCSLVYTEDSPNDVKIVDASGQTVGTITRTGISGGATGTLLSAACTLELESATSSNYVVKVGGNTVGTITRTGLNGSGIGTLLSSNCSFTYTEIEGKGPKILGVTENGISFSLDANGVTVSGTGTCNNEDISLTYTGGTVTAVSGTDENGNQINFTVSNDVFTFVGTGTIPSGTNISLSLAEGGTLKGTYTDTSGVAHTYTLEGVTWVPQGLTLIGTQTVEITKGANGDFSGSCNVGDKVYSFSVDGAKWTGQATLPDDATNVTVSLGENGNLVGHYEYNEGDATKEGTFEIPSEAVTWTGTGTLPAGTVISVTPDGSIVGHYTSTGEEIPFTLVAGTPTYSMTLPNGTIVKVTKEEGDDFKLEYKGKDGELHTITIPSEYVNAIAELAQAGVAWQGKPSYDTSSVNNGKPIDLGSTRGQIFIAGVDVLGAEGLQEALNWLTGNYSETQFQPLDDTNVQVVAQGTQLDPNTGELTFGTQSGSREAKTLQAAYKEYERLKQKVGSGKLLNDVDKQSLTTLQNFFENYKDTGILDNSPFENMNESLEELQTSAENLEKTGETQEEIFKKWTELSPDNITKVAEAMQKIADACNSLTGFDWAAFVDGINKVQGIEFNNNGTDPGEAEGKSGASNPLELIFKVTPGDEIAKEIFGNTNHTFMRTMNLNIIDLNGVLTSLQQLSLVLSGNFSTPQSQPTQQQSTGTPQGAPRGQSGMSGTFEQLDEFADAAGSVGENASTAATAAEQTAKAIQALADAIAGIVDKSDIILNVADAIKKLPSERKVDIKLKVTVTTSNGGDGSDNGDGGDDNSTGAKGTVTVESTFPQKTYVSVINGSGWANAKGNIAFASGRQTLMGELGPELVVSNGRYFVVGQGGAEMVDLAPDAIVFNHIQTRNLLTNGKTGRGRPVTNERKAVSRAKGSVNGGPAMSNASAVLAALKTLRAQLNALSKLSVQDLAGLGGSGGGGGGGSGNNKDSTFLQMLERWYDWLQQIAWIEKEITYQETLRAKLETDQVKNGYAYYQSQQESLDLLKEQIATQSSLNKERQEYFEVRRAEMNANQNPFTALYTFDEHGQIKYQTGALEWLSDLMGRNEDGSAKYTAEQQYNLLKDKYGKYMQYDSSGNKIFVDEKGPTAEEYQKAVQAFWDRIQSDQDEMQDLWNGIKDGQKDLLDLEKQQNEIFNAQRQNQLDLEQEVLKAITDSRQKQIDEIKKEEEIIKKASSDYIDGLNDALSKERSMYENQKQDEELTKLQRQLSILQRTGGSASQIASLQQQIADKQQDIYFDKQQEQIDAIKDASDRQIEKMEQQIELMTKQLEYEKTNGLLWNQVYEILKNPEGEVLNFIMGNQQGWSEKSTLAKSKDMEDIKSMIQQFFAKRNDTEWATFKEETSSGKYKKQWENADIEKAAKAKFSDVLNKGGTIEEAKAAANQVFQEDINTGGWSTYSAVGGDAYKKYEKVWSADLVKKAQDAYATEYASSKDRSKAAAAADKIFDAEIDKGKAVLDLQITHGDGTTTNKTYKEEKAKTWTIADLAKANAKTVDDTNKLTVSQEKVTANPGERKSATATFGASTQQSTSSGQKVRMHKHMGGTAGWQTAYVSPDRVAYYEKLGWSKYAKGGMNYQTGLAWLDGTKSNPEAVLNPEQTKILRDEILSNKPDSFFSLMQQLREEWKAQIQASSSTSTPTEQSTGTIIIEHAEVNLNAEIANDYDATRAGQRVYEELMAMARRAGAGNTIRR